MIRSWTPASDDDDKHSLAVRYSCAEEPAPTLGDPSQPSLHVKMFRSPYVVYFRGWAAQFEATPKPPRSNLGPASTNQIGPTSSICVRNNPSISAVEMKEIHRSGRSKIQIDHHTSGGTHVRVRARLPRRRTRAGDDRYAVSCHMSRVRTRESRYHYYTYRIKQAQATAGVSVSKYK